MVQTVKRPKKTGELDRQSIEVIRMSLFSGRDALNSNTKVLEKLDVSEAMQPIHSMTFQIIEI